MEIPEDFGPDFDQEEREKNLKDSESPDRPMGAVASVIARTAAIMAGISSLITAIVFVSVGAEELSVLKIVAVVAAVSAMAYCLVLFSVRGGFRERRGPPDG